MAPASLLAAPWAGSSTAVSVRFFNGNAADRLTVLNGAGTSPIGVTGGTATSGGMNLRTDFVSAQVTFSATMALSADGKTLTVTLGTPDIPSAIRTAATPAKKMVWTLATVATDLAGNAMAGGSLTESDNDIDF